jgi:hypothetical protein
MKKVPPGEAAHFFSACAWCRKAVPVFEKDLAPTKLFNGRSKP